MKRVTGRLLALALVGLTIVYLPGTIVSAYPNFPQYNSGSQGGFTINGQTDPFVDQVVGGQPGCDPSICGGTPQFRANSFSMVPQGGAWTGVYQQGGDTCADGTGSYAKAANGWNWLWNNPGTYKLASTDWITSQDCNSHGGGHTYDMVGYHNVQNSDGSVNYTIGSEQYRG